jgi:hypothetical protein
MAVISGAVAFAAAGAFTASAGGAIVSGRVSFTAGAELTAAAPPKGRRRRVVVTDVNGTTYGELENAVLSPIVYELNKIDEDWSLGILQNDPKAALILDVPFREVQVWRGDQILAWGPAVRPTVTPVRVSGGSSSLRFAKRTVELTAVTVSVHSKQRGAVPGLTAVPAFVSAT